MSSVIDDLVTEFVGKLMAAAESEAIQKVFVALGSAFPDSLSWTPFREVKPNVVAALGVMRKTLVGKDGRSPKKRATVYCPVPGCQGIAAPIFNMVCRDHKDVPKRTIAKYRRLRRLKASLNLQHGKEAPKKPRKKRATVFCPVPDCKGVAAPIFGMVCRDHRNVSPAKIAKYRKARSELKARGLVEALEGTKKTVKKAGTSVTPMKGRKSVKLSFSKTGSTSATVRSKKKGKVAKVAKKTVRAVAKKVVKKAVEKAVEKGGQGITKVVKKAAKKAAQKEVKREGKKVVKNAVKEADTTVAKEVEMAVREANL